MRNAQYCGGCGRLLIPGRTCRHIIDPTIPAVRPTDTDRTQENPSCSG